MITRDPVRRLMILEFAWKIANRPASRFWRDSEQQLIVGKIVVAAGYFPWAQVRSTNPVSIHPSAKSE
jgi:hypothetical protein